MDIARIYVDILTRENLLSTLFDNMDIINRSIRSSSRKWGEGVDEGKGLDVWYRNHLIRVHGNLVQYPIYNKSIFKMLMFN